MTLLLYIIYAPTYVEKEEEWHGEREGIPNRGLHYWLPTNDTVEGCAGRVGDSGTVVNNETVKNRIIESENVFSQLSRKHACSFHLSILTRSKLRVANRKQLINVRQMATTPIRTQNPSDPHPLDAISHFWNWREERRTTKVICYLLFRFESTPRLIVVIRTGKMVLI